MASAAAIAARNAHRANPNCQLRCRDRALPRFTTCLCWDAKHLHDATCCPDLRPKVPSHRF
eukprot:4516754-Amphidinium_carterae.1